MLEIERHQGFDTNRTISSVCFLGLKKDRKAAEYKIKEFIVDGVEVGLSIVKHETRLEKFECF
jgi:hypothetical protein